MRFINKVFYKLSDIDTKVSMKDKLQTCLKLDIPLLVKVPNGCNVWGIDKQLHKLKKQDVVLSESDYSKKFILSHLLEGKPLSRVSPPEINTLFLGASTLVDGVEYLQVTESNTKKLLASENITIDTFNGVVAFDEKEQHFALHESIPVSPYDFKLGSNTDNEHPIMQKIRSRMSNSRFVLCDKATRSNSDFNFPIGSELDLSVSVLEVVIRESDASTLVFNDKDYQQSAYYLEPEYHASTALLELSRCGYDLYVKNVSVVSGGCSGYLFRNFKSFKKKGEREAGAFLIKDKTGKNFDRVKEVYSHHWLSDTKLSKKNVQEIARNVLDELHEVLDTNDTYIHAIELIIRPDKYKKLK